MIIECPQCKNKISSTSKFCNNCGTEIKIQGFTCPNCGKSNIPEEALYCPDCGQQLKPSEVEQEDLWSKRKYWIIGGIAGLLIILLLILFVNSENGGTQKESISNESPLINDTLKQVEPADTAVAVQ